MHLKFSASPALVFVFSWFSFQSFFWARALLPEAQHIHLLESEVKRIREDTQTHTYTPKPKKNKQNKNSEKRNSDKHATHITYFMLAKGLDTPCNANALS